MRINYSTTQAAGTGANVGAGYPPNASWVNPTNIEDDDASSATLNFFEGGQGGDALVANDFGFDLPDFAIIDGIEITIVGSNTGCLGSVILGTEFVSADTLNKVYGGPTDKWNQEWTIADFNTGNPAVNIALGDVSGGDGFAAVQYMTMTVYWHINIDATEADVPTRVDYKVFSRDGAYIGLVPDVTSKLAFSQDKNSAGSTMNITSAQNLKEVTDTDVLMTEADTDILTEDSTTILTEATEIFITTGESEDYAIFKNSNRIEAWIYNYWHPNGKRMFKGQVNKITFSYGGSGDAVNMLVYSDGFDMANFIARGLPATLTADVTQGSQNGYFTISGVAPGWNRYGQSWRSGSVDNIGAITLKLRGTADVTIDIYDEPNGNLLGSITKSVSSGGATDVQFVVASLIDIEADTDYFFGVRVATGQTIRVYKHSTSSTYADGTAYNSSYSGGSGGGSWSAITGDLYFVTYEGELTTTAAFTSDDPVTDIASDVLADYNDRGGFITERDFDATGLSISYTWILSSIFDLLVKVLELSPLGWYFYIDLGSAEIDMKQINPTADFTIVNGKDIHQLAVSLSTEQVANQLLFTGGDTGGGTNLYRAYLDAASSSRYGLRTRSKSDNRVTVAGTADAIGETFIEENSEEVQETRITILNSSIDITLLTPGQTIGFVNFDNMVDDFVLQIVRRDYTPEATILTLGRLPVNLSSNVQSINRGLLNEQTVDNPSSPS